MSKDNFYITKDELLKRLKEAFNTKIDRYDDNKSMYLKIGQEEVIEFIEQIQLEET